MRPLVIFPIPPQANGQRRRIPLRRDSRLQKSCIDLPRRSMVPRLPKALPQHKVPVGPAVRHKPRIGHPGHPTFRSPDGFPGNSPAFFPVQFSNLQRSSQTIGGELQVVQKSDPFLAPFQRSQGLGFEALGLPKSRQGHRQILRLRAEPHLANTALGIAHIRLQHEQPLRDIRRHRRQIFCERGQIHLAHHRQSGLRHLLRRQLQPVLACLLGGHHHLSDRHIPVRTKFRVGFHAGAVVHQPEFRQIDRKIGTGNIQLGLQPALARITLHPDKAGQGP